jgi:hypothetical protein
MRFLSAAFILRWGAAAQTLGIDRSKEDPMRSLIIATALLLAMPGIASAQAPAAPAAPSASCKAQAAEKKLAGAANTSFMKKCQADAQKACTTSAADKKLAGAAKNSFTKKCVTDAVGA